MKAPYPYPSASLPESLLANLDMAVLERRTDGAFRLIGEPPTWLAHLLPEANTSSEALHPEATFLFLDHFLVEAENFWKNGQEESVSSGPWTEVDVSGREWLLEATALRVEERPLLLLRPPVTDHQTLRNILQESREQGLEHHRLIKEVNKREVLLHCIVHDLSTPLAGIKGSLSLLKEDDLVRDDGKRLLQIGINQVEKMQGFIREILQSFAQEVQPLLPTLVTADTAPDVGEIARDVTNALQAYGALKDVRFRVDADPDAVWKITGEATRLERVLFNLVENALRYSPPGAEVVIRLNEADGFIQTTVEDAGPGVPEEQVTALFNKFSQGSGLTGKAGLGLYFCRITVEGWGGTIGYSPRPGGGAQFWFRLPRPTLEA